MKRIILAMAIVCTVCFSYAGWAIPNPDDKVEIYLSIPGEKPLHIVSAQVTMLGDGLVHIVTPWGVRYITSMANVVIVYR